MTPEILTNSEEETSAIGERLAASLRQGDVVLLYGELGAGKTAFVRGLARGLGASPEDVSSPTFTLIQEYAGRVTLYHVDLYRLASPDELPFLGFSELDDGLLLVEWPERAPALASRADLVVRLAYAGAGRTAELVAASPRGARLLDSVTP